MFIRLAEERILKTVQLSLFQKNATAQTSSGQKYLAVPSDFLAPYSLALTVNGDEEFLLFKDADFVQTYTPDASVTGVPKYYAQFDVDNFILGPTPDAAYTAELHYLYRPASITAGSDSGTTWLSENAEIALLYGALVEAYIYMKGDAGLMNDYSKRLQEAVVSLKQLGEAKETTDMYRMGMIVRQKV